MQRRTMIVGGAALGLTLARPGRAAAAPVVLELFTSQGCSSCPPADVLLGELAKQPGVIALAWHVDYWNNLGWRDPFARVDWTRRQRFYAKVLGDEVYTPALVVNGSSMVIGNNGPAVRQAMSAAPALSVPVAIQRTRSGLEVEISGMPDNGSALLAMYHPEQVTAVAAGENAGRQLRDYRVVMGTRRVIPSNGLATMPDVPAGQGAVVLVHDASARIIGAADLPAS